MHRTATIALVFLMWALPASAEHRNARPDRGGDRIAALANRIEDTAHRAYERALQRAGHRDRGDRVAIQSLRQLDAAAHAFDRRVDRVRNDARALQELRDLKVALRDAQRNVRRLHARPVEKDVQRVAALVGDLDRAYAALLRDNRRARPEHHAAARPLLHLLAQALMR